MSDHEVCVFSLENGVHVCDGCKRDAVVCPVCKLCTLCVFQARNEELART